MDRLFLPFIANDQGKTLELENGVVVPKINPDPINESPEGWEENVIQFTRNTEFVGIVKAYTTSLKFFSDAATILRTIFYTKGVEFVLFFIWLKLDLSFGGEMKYRDWYKGEFDLSTFKDGWDSVQVNIIEGGFYKELQANKNIPYQIEFDEDAVSVEMDGMELFNKLNFVPSDGFQYKDNDWTAILPLTLQEGTNSSIEIGNQIFESIANTFTYFPSSENWAIKNASSANQIVKITGKVRYTAAQNGTLPKSFFQLKFQKNSMDQNDNTYRFISGNPTAGQIFEVDLNYEITLLPDERLFLTGRQNSVNFALFSVEFLEGSEIIIDFASTKPETIIDAMRTFDVGNKLCQKISNNASVLKSDLLSEDYNLLITCGDAIRSVPNSVIKTKITDWHKSVHCVKCVSFGVEDNNGRLENRKYAFSEVEISNLGEVKIGEDFLEPANEYRYSSIEIGYPPKDIGSINGRYSFNNTLIFKTPKLKGGENIYDAKSIYLSDPYVIESLRIDTIGQATTDTESDNSVFFLDCERVYENYVGSITFSTVDNVYQITINGIGKNLKVGVRFKILTGQNTGAYKIIFVKEEGGNTIIHVADFLTDEMIDTTIEFLHYKLRRKAYASIEGLPAVNTVFNIELSPRRNLGNHFGWLAGAMHKMEDGFFTYQTTDKNSELVTTDLNNVVIKETENIPIATLGPKIFLPYYFNAEAISQISLLDKIKINPGGFFTFAFNNYTFKGYIDDIKSNEATLETQDYRLLCKGDVNLENLIYNR